MKPVHTRARGLHRPEPNEIGRAEAEAQLVMLLTNMPDERLFAATVDSLAAINRSPRRVIECRLLAAQNKRRRQNAA